MLNLDDFQDCVVVMAHPDDEILWASAVLARAKKIVLCYGESPGYPAVGEGRRALLGEFPLETVVSLDIPESDVHLAADWRRPVETQFGIACGRNGEAYARNFDLLKAALAAHLADGDLVVTHNPWGEYGHEEHVQVYRAVAAMKRERDFRLFVSGYVSDRVLPFMARNMPRLGGAVAMLPTDKALAERLKALYQRHRIWTWEDAYAWPDRECFYEVTGPDAPLRADQRTMVSLPVNVLWLDGQLPVVRRMLRGVKRRLRTLAYRFSRAKG